MFFVATEMNHPILLKLISLHEFVFQETPEASPLPSPHPGNFAEEASSNFNVKKQSPPSTSRVEHPEVAAVNNGVDNGVNNGVDNGVDAGVVIPSKSAAVSRDNHAAATNTAAYNNHGSNNNNSTSATNNSSSNNNNNKSLDGEPVFGLSVADMRARLQAKKRADVREADNNRNFKEKYEIFQKL